MSIPAARQSLHLLLVHHTRYWWPLSAQVGICIYTHKVWEDGVMYVGGWSCDQWCGNLTVFSSSLFSSSSSFSPHQLFSETVTVAKAALFNVTVPSVECITVEPQ